MNPSVIQSKEILSKIRVVFSERRRDQSHKRWYPKALKDLAVSALEHGHAQSEVARAAGVSEGSIRNWRKSKKVERRSFPLDKQKRPLELKLIEGREVVPAPSLESGISNAPSEAIARIEFRSGVRIALPVSALSERLFGLLQGDLL
jgi:transposase-like protein